MKKIILGLTAAVAFSSVSAQASNLDVNVQRAINSALRAEILSSAMNVINWKVGDYQEMKIEMIFGGGDGRKEATKEDTAQNAVWMVQTMSILGQEQKSEALISRADGKVLKMIVNGEEQAPSSDQSDIEIIEQEETSVTVPAGTFDCIRVKAKVKANGQDQEMELWANPVDVNLDGMLKVVLQSQFGPITISLTEFGPRS